MNIPGVQTALVLGIAFETEELGELAQMVSDVLAAGTSSFAVFNGGATSMGEATLLLSPASVERLAQAGWPLPLYPDSGAGTDPRYLPFTIISAWKAKDEKFAWDECFSS